MSTKQPKFKNIEKIKLKKDESLLVTVDLLELGLESDDEVLEYMQLVEKYFNNCFPGTKILVVPDSIKVKAIEESSGE